LEPAKKAAITTLDDLFGLPAAPPGEAQILQIPLDQIDPFPEHPFHVREDEAMTTMVESVKAVGVLTPAVAREKEDGRYELVSGHRRKHACELAGLEAMKAVVGKDGSVVLFEVTNERIPGEPVEQEEPEVPVAPDEPLPKTGDSKTIVVVALVVLILAGGAVLWLRKRRKPEDEPAEEPADKE
jgi:LPXTG-motif cell wall-anchored protein